MMCKYKKKNATQRAWADEMGSPKKPPGTEQAQVRIVMLALASFLSGVAATAFWFHLTSHRTATDLSSQVNSQGNPPDDRQFAAPPSGANSPVRTFVEPPVPVAAAAVEDVKRALPN